MEEAESEVHTNEGGQVHETEEVTFGFPIMDPNIIIQMKNIHPSILPHVHGLVSEYHDALLFKFGILCRNYDYISDAQKQRFFLATLKDVALRWFMGFGGGGGGWGGSPLEDGSICVEFSSRNIKITISLGN
jgi:hypothetical protein